MRLTRQFRPQEPAALEDRIAPSQLAGGGNHTAVSGALRAKAPAHVAAAKATPTPKVTFSADIADTIAAGSPVEEQRTTRLGPGATQTEYRLIQPNNTNGTTLTTSVITLPRNGGTENVTDFSYTTVSNQTVHVITTTLPDSSIQIENKTEQTQGSTTQTQATVKYPSGGVGLIVGTSVTQGATTTTDETDTDPNGAVTRHHIVTVEHGERRETTSDTLTDIHGARQVTHSTTTIVRLAPPSLISLGAPVPGSVASPPTIA